MSEINVPNQRLRRHLKASEKLEIVQASYQPGALVAEIARKYQVGVSSLIKWRKNALEGGLMAVKDGESGISAAEAKKLKKEIQQLQRLLGKKSLQIELLKDAVKIGQEKKLISQHALSKVEDIVFD